MKSVVATLVSAAVFSSVIATGASSQVADNGKVLVASNTLRLTADTVRSGTVATPTKEFIVPFAGMVRVRWRLKSDGSGELATATAQSTIDSCSSSTASATFEGSKCDLRVLAGDLVRVSAHGTTDFNTFITSTAFIKFVRIYFDVVDNPGTGETLAD